MVAISGGVFASWAGCLRDDDVMVSKSADVVGDVTSCMQVQKEAIWKFGGRARTRARAKRTRQ